MRDRILFAGAVVKAWLAFRIIMLLGPGPINGWRWHLLPSCGDWAYRKDGGRLSSLEMFTGRAA